MNVFKVRIQMQKAPKIAQMFFGILRELIQQKVVHVGKENINGVSDDASLTD